MLDSLPRQSLRILICEDEAIIGLALCQTLEHLGHQVCGVAATADDGVALACRHRPDLVIMDIMLRGDRDGIDAALDILRLIGCRSLFMSAVDSPQVRDRVAAVDPLGFLCKPYRAEELRRLLERVAPVPSSATGVDAGLRKAGGV